MKPITSMKLNDDVFYPLFTLTGRSATYINLSRYYDEYKQLKEV